jgi:N-acetylneuraminic acid mutarotase
MSRFVSRVRRRPLALSEPLEGRQYWSAAPASAELTPVPGALTGLTLYNAVDDVPIGPLENYAWLSHVEQNTWGFTFKAETSGAIGSVKWGFNGDGEYSVENYTVFSIAGDLNGTDMQPFQMPQGRHTVKATAYSGKDGTGAVLGTMTSTFDVVDTPNGGGAPVIQGPVVTFSDNTADAKEQGLDRGTWVISRTGSTASSLTVKYNTGGTAISGTDYEVLSGTITIPAGQSSVQLVVRPKEDTLVEGTETVVVTLAPNAAYTVGASNTATCPIADNDFSSQPSPTPTPTPTPSTGQNISDITWTRNAPRAPEPKTEAGVVQVGSKIYSIGGFTGRGGTGSFFPLTRKVYSYDMATRTYKTLASIPSQAAGNHFGVASDGANIYIIAGQLEATYGRGTNTAWKYNIASNSWSQFKSLPEIRFGGAAFIINGKLHFVGGDKADRTTTASDHWEIDLSNSNANWVRKASIPLAGDHMSHATINGKVYLFGGEHGHKALNGSGGGSYIQHNYTFEYNPSNDSWARKANMPLALSHIEGSTLVINGKAVLIGGLLDGGDENTTSRQMVYDPVANSWKTLSTRYPKRIIGASSGYWNGKIYMSEGYSPDEDDRQVGFEGTVRFS